MKHLIPLILFAIGYLIGISRHQPKIEANTNTKPTATIDEVALKEPKPGIPPASDWKSLLSGLPTDSWEAILPLNERVQQFRTLDDIATLLETSVRELPPEDRERFYWIGETLIPLLAQRAAEIDPRGAIALGLKKPFPPLFPLSFHALAKSEDFEILYDSIPSEHHERILRTCLPILMKERPDFGLRLAEDADQLPTAYSHWAQHQPSMAASDLLKRPPGPSRKDAMTSLAITWAESDSAAVVRWAQSLDIDAERQDILRLALGVGMRQHPEQTMKTAIEHGDPYTVSECALIFGRADLQKAFATASVIEEPNFRQTALGSLMRVAADTGDLEMLLQIQRELPIGVSAAFKIRQSIQILNQEDPIKAIAWLQATDDREMFAQAKQVVLETWIQRDLRAASAYVAEHPEMLTEYENISSITRGLAAVAPSEAATWILNLPDQRMRGYGLGKVMNSWAAQDTEGATAFALNLEAPKERQASLATVGSHLISYQQDVTAWLAQLPEQDRAYQTSSAAKKIADQDSGEAFRLLLPFLERADPPADVTKAMADVIASWSYHEPQEAVEWLIQQTDHPDMQSRGMATTMRKTAEESPTQAIAMMDQLEPGPIFDQAAVGFVAHMADFDPQTAFTHASKISDDALRHRTQRQVIMEMARIDLPNAMTTLEKAKLPQKQIDRIHRDISSQLDVTLPTSN